MRHFSELERQIAGELLKTGFSWIARDRREGINGHGLFVYGKRPHWSDKEQRWEGYPCRYLHIPISDFMEPVQWTDDGPTSLEAIVGDESGTPEQPEQFTENELQEIILWMKYRKESLKVFAEKEDLEKEYVASKMEISDRICKKAERMLGWKKPTEE